MNRKYSVPLLHATVSGLALGATSAVAASSDPLGCYPYVRTYASEMTSATSSRVAWRLEVTDRAAADPLMSAITSVYQELLANQTRLPEVFEQVLEEQAWDMYARS